MTDPERIPSLQGEEAEARQVERYIVESLDDKVAFVEDIIQPRKGAVLNREPLGLTFVMILAQGVSVRTLRPKGEGRYENGPIVDLDPGSLFRAGDGEIVIMFNRGSSPISKRKFEFDPGSEFNKIE